jgi:hypothetical protein
VLGEKCGLQVAASTVHYFVRVRRPANEKRRRVQPAGAVLSGIKISGQSTSRAATPVMHTESQRSVRQRIADLKDRPARPERSVATFHFDPNEPLRLKQGQGKTVAAE